MSARCGRTNHRRLQLAEPDTVRIMARIPAETGRLLIEIAVEQDRSLSSIIRLALREWCEKHVENEARDDV